MRPVVYVTSAVDFDKHKSELKLRPCPHCCVVGCLIQHGYLRGHGDGSHDEVQRGWRVFCSDRHQRSGCGKTHSILLTEFIFHRMVKSAHLWQLLHNLREGLRLKAAWEKIVSSFSLDTGYRLRAAFTRSQSFIRSLLLRAGPLPKMKVTDPALQVIEHLSAIFPGSLCPVADFQFCFQTAFLHTVRVNRSG
jgi:hypothetical protein